MGVALQRHVQIFADEIISGICFEIIMRGCGEVVGIQIKSLVMNRSLSNQNGVLKAHQVTFRFCMFDIFHGKNIF